MGVPAAADPPDSERALALARLGAMWQGRSCLMTKLHRNLLKSKWLQVKEEHGGCCCTTCHAKCFSLSLLPLVAGGLGSHNGGAVGDELTW